MRWRGGGGRARQQNEWQNVREKHIEQRQGQDARLDMIGRWEQLIIQMIMSEEWMTDWETTKKPEQARK